MDDVTKQSLLSAVRTLLAAGGAWMATHKYIDAAAVNEIVGALMILIPIIWGVWDKHRAEEVAKARETVAINVGIAVADATIGPTRLVTAAEAPTLIKTVLPTLPAGPAEPVAPEVQPTTKDSTAP